MPEPRLEVGLINFRILAKEELVQKGEEADHRERIRREQRLLRQVEKKLSGS
jgi:hypothetical protein